MGRTKKKYKINIYKQLRAYAIIAIIILGIIAIIKFIPKGKAKNEVSGKTAINDSVSKNGWLHVEGQGIKNENGETYQLVGVSSNDFQWYSDCLTSDNLDELKDEWGVNVIRLAIFPEGEGATYSESLNEKIEDKIDLIIEKDMYVIIDWHIKGNPNRYKENAKVLFEEISNKYGNKENVMYEICSEPSGENIYWDEDIKPYAEEIIKIIRNNSKKSIIIVGTPKNCTDLSKVKDDLLEDNNVLYSYHFYVGDEKADIEDLNSIIENKIPVIVSEWGLTDSTKKGSIYLGIANKWVKVLNENNISWIIWSFSRKDEATSALKYEYKATEDIEDYLTESGDYMKKTIMKYKKGISEE